MKALLTLTLMVALLTIGNTAAACPLRVCMGGSIKPDKGWGAGGRGVEYRQYKGTLPFRGILIEGTRDGGACAIGAGGDTSTRDKALSSYDHLRSLLVDKYGEPDKEESREGASELDIFSILEPDRKKRKEMFPWNEYPEARWFNFDPNPDKIDQIVLRTIKRNTGSQMLLKYWFENYIDECRKAEAGEL